MPLHDWSEQKGWEGVHDIWIVELLRNVMPQLPSDYRAHIGSNPNIGIGFGDEKPDVSVRTWETKSASGSESAGNPLGEPDEEVATLTLEPQKAITITRRGALVAAIELISPRNKDRISARAVYLTRYLSYLQEGANLLIVDLHPEPKSFSFAEEIGKELRLKSNPFPAPFAISYRVGERAPDGGRFLATWRRPLKIGQPMPAIPLALTVHASISVELEETYRRASMDAYLD